MVKEVEYLGNVYKVPVWVNYLAKEAVDNYVSIIGFRVEPYFDSELGEWCIGQDYELGINCTLVHEYDSSLESKEEFPNSLRGV